LILSRDKLMIALACAVAVGGMMRPAPAAAQGRFAVRAGGYLNADGELIRDVTLVVSGGKIEAIGKDITPPAGCVVLERTDAILGPGFIDPHVSLGTLGLTAEAANAIETEADAADLFNRHHHDFDRAVRAGFTTVILAPSSTHLVGGSTAVVKTAGDDPGCRLIGHGPLKLSLRSEAFSTRRTPTSLQGGLSDLRQRLADARKNGHDKSAFARWARGETVAIVDVDTVAALGSLARFATEESVRCIGLHANLAAERMDAAKSLGEALILGTYEFSDPLRYTRLPGLLKAEGVPFALTSNAPRYGPELLRVGAAIAMKQGLSVEDALAALTTTPAEIAGVSRRVGSLEVGKDADFLVLSGHPMHLSSRILEVFVDGERVYRAEPAAPAKEDER